MWHGVAVGHFKAGLEESSQPLWLSRTAKTLGSSDKENGARRSVGRNTTEQSERRRVQALQLNTLKSSSQENQGAAELGSGRKSGTGAGQRAHPDALSKGQKPLRGREVNLHGWQLTACPRVFFSSGF